MEYWETYHQKIEPKPKKKAKAFYDVIFGNEIIARNKPTSEAYKILNAAKRNPKYKGLTHLLKLR